MNNHANTNQHYVSQVLQRRFAVGGFLERFDLRWNKWKRVSTAQIFSRLGYSQLLAYGKHDNTLDESFKQYENSLNDTLTALDEAGNHQTTELSDEVSNNLCWYCAYVWRMSPFVKAVCPFEFAMQLELDLKHGNQKVLEDLGIKQEDIVTIRLLYAQGKKFIPSGANSEQLLFRIQFTYKCGALYRVLRHFCSWTLYSSPITMPIGDMPCFQFNSDGVGLYVFAISPSQVLVGKPRIGAADAKLTLKTNLFTMQEAEYIRDAICASALTAVASKDRSIDVLAARERAKDKIRFPVIKNLNAVMSAGLTEFNDVFRIVPVSEDEYGKWKQSFCEKPS
ncbi:MAG: hypothetical protein JWR69_3993 [Pedosphaera sp.]|nr:hypothetical protein [Pedosphaera sp.]